MIKNDNMEDKKFYEFLLLAFKNELDALDNGAEAYIASSGKSSSPRKGTR